MLQTKVLQKIETYVLCLIAFYSEKPCCLGDYVEEYGRACQATDGNVMDN